MLQIMNNFLTIRQKPYRQTSFSRLQSWEKISTKAMQVVRYTVCTNTNPQKQLVKKLPVELEIQLLQHLAGQPPGL